MSSNPIVKIRKERPSQELKGASKNDGSSAIPIFDIANEALTKLDKANKKARKSGIDLLQESLACRSNSSGMPSPRCPPAPVP